MSYHLTINVSLLLFRSCFLYKVEYYSIKFNFLSEEIEFIDLILSILFCFLPLPDDFSILSIFLITISAQNVWAFYFHTGLGTKLFSFVTSWTAYQLLFYSNLTESADRHINFVIFWPIPCTFLIYYVHLVTDLWVIIVKIIGFVLCMKFLVFLLYYFQSNWKMVNYLKHDPWGFFYLINIIYYSSNMAN